MEIYDNYSYHSVCYNCKIGKTKFLQEGIKMQVSQRVE